MGYQLINSNSILGENQLIPKLIPLKTKIEQISCGNWHAAALDINGKL